MIFSSQSKKGRIQTTPDGSLELVNEDNVSYNVDKDDVAVWNQCTDITFEHLCGDVASKIRWQVPTDVLSYLERYVNRCIYAKLIEVRNFTPDKFSSLMQDQSHDFDKFEKLFVS